MRSTSDASHGGVLGGSCGVSAGCGSVEDYAAEFDGLISRLAQRRGFRDYLIGPLAPRDRNKTLTGLAGSEPVVGAQHAAVSNATSSTPRARALPPVPRRASFRNPLYASG